MGKLGVYPCSAKRLPSFFETSFSVSGGPHMTACPGHPGEFSLREGLTAKKRRMGYPEVLHFVWYELFDQERGVSYEQALFCPPKEKWRISRLEVTLEAKKRRTDPVPVIHINLEALRFVRPHRRDVKVVDLVPLRRVRVLPHS